MTKKRIMTQSPKGEIFLCFLFPKNPPQLQEPLRNDGDNEPRNPQPERAETKGQEKTWVFNQGVVDPDGEVQFLQLFFR